MRKWALHILLCVCLIAGASEEAFAQCSNYTISVSTGSWPSEVSWSLQNSSNVIVASGGAPANVIVCLPPGCYTMVMYDSFGDGWNGSVFSVISAGVTVASGTMSTGSYATQQFPLGGGSCTPVASCPGGLTPFFFSVTTGSWPGEVSWTITNNGSVVTSGGAGATNILLCLSAGCYVLNMYDSFGDGWNGSNYSLTDANGVVLYSGTLSMGSFGTASFGILGGDCGTSEVVTASDCIQAVNVCEDLNFTIDPNGWGLINEIPPLGSVSNPSYSAGDGVTSPWGSDNWGCLMANELNSTWMIVNIWGSGWLEFSFGANGTQAGFYDWIMWPYDPDNTCQDIYNNVLPPVRCNWNATSVGGTGLASTLPPGGSWGNYEPPLWVNAGEQYLICFSNWSSVTSVVPLDFGGTAIVSCQSVLLPVELYSFTGEAANGFSWLRWNTLSEMNSSHFEVERSQDGDNWIKLGHVAAAGNSMTERIYEFRDENPPGGLCYYRLRMVDRDGTFTYSDLVQLEIVQWDIQVFPNPSAGLFMARTPESVAGDLYIESSRGRALNAVLMPASGNGTLWHIDLSNMPEGIYTLRHKSDPSFHSRLVVQR